MFAILTPVCEMIRDVIESLDVDNISVETVSMADIIFGEHSLTMIEDGLQKKLFAALCPRLSLMGSRVIYSTFR